MNTWKIILTIMFLLTPILLNGCAEKDTAGQAALLAACGIKCNDGSSCQCDNPRATWSRCDCSGTGETQAVCRCGTD